MITIQASWHEHSWGFVRGAAKGLQALSRLRALKTVQQANVRGGASLNFRGFEPFSCSLSWTITAASRGSEADADFVRKEIAAWEADLGQDDTLIVGGEAWHDRPLRLISVASSDIQLDGQGRLISATITASWAEVLPEQDEKRRRKNTLRKMSPATEKALGIASGADVKPSAEAKRMAAQNQSGGAK